MELGTAFACVISGGALCLTAFTIPFISPAFRRICIPYVPATQQQIKNVISLLKRAPPKMDPIIDLGSGDGRVVSFFIYRFNLTLLTCLAVCTKILQK